MKRSAAILCGLVGVLCGAGGYTVYYAEGLSYLSNNPKACVNCHVMREEYDGWQKSSHHAHATCNGCHLPEGFLAKYFAKARNGWNHSKAFTLQDFHEPIRIHPENSRILNLNCIRCHRDFVSDVLPIAGPKAEPMNCVRCHDGVGHGPTR